MESAKRLGCSSKFYELKDEGPILSSMRQETGDQEQEAWFPRERYHELPG